MISTQNLTALPDIPTLRRLTQSLAMLDAILSPEWESRYYSFNSRWAEGEMMASMRNGSGDDWFLVFNQAGAILKGFAHESPMADSPTREGVLSEVPAVFSKFLTEPAFSMEYATFCIWRTVDDSEWHRGDIKYPPDSPDPDGSADLLALLDDAPQSYQQWAEEYYETEVSLAAVEAIYRHEPLTAEMVALLNPDISLEDLEEDLLEIGYPA
jgi:hypothetical protein